MLFYPPSSKILWLVTLHLLQAQFFSFFVTTPIIKSSYLLLDDSTSTNEINKKDDYDISIERVSTRARVLDVRVFRGFSISAPEYIKRQTLELNFTILEEDAIKQLTSSYDNNGKELDFIGHPVVQYIAVAYQQRDYEFSAEQECTNGVIGAVDAKIQWSPSSSLSTGQLGRLPWPHVSLKNLNVHENFRRMGVASALVGAVQVFAREEGMRAVILEVDCENTGAVSLYKKEGFVFIDESEKISGKMILVLE